MGSQSLDSFKDKHLLLVGTGGIKRRRVIESLRGLGLRRITCLLEHPNWASPYVDDWVEADSVRPSLATFEKVQTQIGRPDGVFCYDDYSVIVAAHLAHAFGLPGVNPVAAERAKNKGAFRQLCADRGLPTPRFIVIDAAEDCLEAVLSEAQLFFPLVLKPTYGAGSVLVRRANDIKELKRALFAYREAVTREPAAKLWPDLSVVIEEYLVGVEVDIDMLVQDGELRYAAVTDNFAPVEPYFMELAGQIPSALPQAAQDELISVAFNVLRALCVQNCCVHFEARWTNRGAVPIESNLRLGGAEAYEFNRGAYGVDLVAEAVRIALGLPIAPFATAKKAVAFLRSAAFIPPVSGVLKSIQVEPKVENDELLAELTIFRHVGDAILVPPDGFDYIGWIVARGRSRAEVDEKLVELVSGIRFEIASTTFHGAYLGRAST